LPKWQRKYTKQLKGLPSQGLRTLVWICDQELTEKHCGDNGNQG
jgi:hypothetical protein